VNKTSITRPSIYTTQSLIKQMQMLLVLCCCTAVYQLL